MNFALSDEHLLLRDSARSFLQKEIDLSPLLVPRATVQSARYQENWRKMVDLGWPGLIVPEKFGGAGMSPIDLVMVSGEIGRFLAPSPLFGDWAGTLALLKGGSVTQQERVLPDIASGQIKLALAVCDHDGNADGPKSDSAVRRRGSDFTINGTKSFVVDAVDANFLVVAAELDGARQWYLVDASQSGVEIKLLPWRDTTRQVCNVSFDGVIAEPLVADDRTLWPWVRDRLLMVLAAESAGGLQHTLASAVDYAKERVAFGKPIGAFQSIKHTLAEMFGWTEAANAAVLYAAWTLAEESEEASSATAMAKAYCTEAYVTATHQNIQIFGAIGFTWEMKNHLYFKRARANAEMFGSAATHRARVIEMVSRAAA